ncbi:hypothetical protein HWV62_40601 [Athelia sp. TMB]|nr:hypothetical protein HWV62_2808 [Athelia sp. TMB]KAF7979850.1 hypothetical protein HWV62_40601 [Athelia sp. TMB]
MNDTARVWNTPMVLAPGLAHESNQNSTYAAAAQHHQHPDPYHHDPTQHQQFMSRAPPFDINNQPLSYPPPPPPPARAAGAYGQAPQGAPYPPPTQDGAPQSQPQPMPNQNQNNNQNVPAPARRRDGRSSPKPESFYAPNAAELYTHAQMLSQGQSPSPGPSGSDGGSGHYPVTRLPPILQVEKQQVTTTATQAASASRRRNEAHFSCPVPGCGSTFTRRFNLRGHLRSHTEERPYVCDVKDCGKGFARQHDCKRHQALHSTKSQANLCPGCKKTFSRLDALNRHRKSYPRRPPNISSANLLTDFISAVRSEGGAECRQIAESRAAEAISAGTGPSAGPAPAGRKRKADDDTPTWGANAAGGSTNGDERAGSRLKTE